MMTDRDLLELAAKAAGLSNFEWEDIGLQEQTVHGDPHYGTLGPIWNPLTDDGDALRLAVLLKFMVDVDGVFCTTVTHGAEDFCELHMGDQYAATRRAIVRAASEIGKSIT